MLRLLQTEHHTRTLGVFRNHHIFAGQYWFQVAIVNNNLGNVYTLQARALSDKAASTQNKTHRANIMKQVRHLYCDAETNYHLAIKDAQGLWDALKQRADGARADDAVFLQLANRKYNLALCLAAKAKIGDTSRGDCPPDPVAIKNILDLILDCVLKTVDANDPKSSQRKVEFLLQFAAIECDQEGGQRAAAEAIHVAERVIDDYSAQVDAGHDVDGRLAMPPPQEVSPPAPVSVLRQQVLAARGALCVAEGNPVMAIRYWSSAILDCGNRMDVRAVVSSLEGLRGLASSGKYGAHFSPELLQGLDLTRGGGQDTDTLTYAIESASTRVQRLEFSAGLEATKSGRYTGKKYWTTNVDLCFVMDCTESVRSGQIRIPVLRWGLPLSFVHV